MDMHAVPCCGRPEQFEALEKSDKRQSYVFIDQSRHHSIISKCRKLNCRLNALQLINKLRDPSAEGHIYWFHCLSWLLLPFVLV